VSPFAGRCGRWAGRKNVAVDWATLHVAGPDEVVGAHGRVWYEWTATAESVTATDRTLVPPGVV
jgi:hypothetical protein